MNFLARDVDMSFSSSGSVFLQGLGLMFFLSGCVGSGFSQWEWPPLPLCPVEEDPVQCGLYAYQTLVPVKAHAMLILPLVHQGRIDDRTFEFAVAHPFIYHRGETLVPPGGIKDGDGEVCALTVIAPGYWQGDMGRTFLEEFTFTIEGKKQLAIEMTPVRSKEEAQAVLGAFELLLSQDSFTVTPPFDLLKTDMSFYEANSLQIAAARGIISYMKYGNPNRTGRYSGGWFLPRGTPIEIILTGKDKLLIKSFMESARRELETNN